MNTLSTAFVKSGKVKLPATVRPTIDPIYGKQYYGILKKVK
ncbi:hypothetical protein V7147_14015 [Bacillus sp. JJ1521]